MQMLKDVIFQKIGQNSESTEKFPFFLPANL